VNLRRRRDEKASRVERLAARAWYVLVWERAWPSIAAILSLAAFFVALSWLGLWIESPRWARIGGCLVFAALLLGSFWPIVFGGRITREDRLARLDRDSEIPHRPASSLADRLANGAGDPTTAALWTLHQRRLERTAATLRLAAPSPRLAQRDRYALRAAAVVALVGAAFVAGPEKYPRILAAFDWRTVGSPASGFRLDAWIDPPAYTGRPPLLLTGSDIIGANGDLAGIGRRSVQAPVDSTIIVRSTEVGGLSIAATGGLKPALASTPDTTSSSSRPLPISDQPAADEHTDEQRWTLRGDGELVLRRYGSTIAQFNIASIPDKPPSIALVGRPRSNIRGSLTLDYKVADDYGVAGAEADFADPVLGGRKLPRHTLVGPPKVTLSLPPGARGLGQAETTTDLSDHPWAGARVTMTLSARDDAGNIGLSDPIQITLPQRVFTKPLARALVEQRRNLVLDPDHRDRVATAIGALMIAPELFNVSPSIYLGLTNISYSLRDARSDADLLSVANLMWEMALQIEDGDLAQKERDLRAAQQQLRDALQRGAPDSEIKKLMDQLRARLDTFLQALMQREMRNGQQAQLSPNERALTQRDLQSMLDRLENMARSGDLADAQRMLNQLQNLLDNLQTAQQGQPNPLAQEMNRELNELDQMTRDQQALRDKTFRQSQNGSDDQTQQNQSPSRPDAGQSLQALHQEQQGLRQRLEALQRRMKQMGLDARQGLGDADKAMREAEQDLGEGQNGQGDAVGAQGRALQALRRGAQSLAQQMQQNGIGVGQMAGPGQPDDGSAQPGSNNPGLDPLGREAQNPEYDSYSRYDPLGAPAAQRAQQVLEELRRRLGDEGRPREELDYFERLLHPY
jgi:uncharacterized protein (TIGR02302 family)